MVQLEEKKLYTLLQFFFSDFFCEGLEKAVADEEEEVSVVTLFRGMEFFFDLMKEQGIEFPYMSIEEYITKTSNFNNLYLFNVLLIIKMVNNMDDKYLDIVDKHTPKEDRLKRWDTEEAIDNWNNMSKNERTSFLNKMWRNENVADMYEPGSTFKALISAIALEEDITEVDVAQDFYCNRYENINGTKIRCWSTKPHKYETLTDALANSCNPAFMQLGQKIGIELLYKYFDAFGLFSTTGISLPGEESGIFHSTKKVGPVELATTSFGQRFSITPIQLITAISSLANDGKLVQPQIVSKIVNNDTGSITTTQTNEIRQVVSKETADAVIDMMEYVVSNGTGKKGAVKGYTIAGKTGTSEAAVGSDNGNTLSYVAIAPSENPSLVALVVLYNTPTTRSQGSTIAGPIMSNILSEVLPYLGITSDEVSISSNNSLITVPNIINKTVTEAEKILKNSGFNPVISFEGDKNSTLVATQVPSNGTKLLKDSVVLLYSEGNSTRTSVTVPDLTGMTLTQAKTALKQKNLNISYTGNGLVSEQSIKNGTSVEEGTIINVTLSY